MYVQICVYIAFLYSIPPVYIYQSIYVNAPFRLCMFAHVCVDSQWIVPQIFKLLPKWHIFSDLVIMLITNRKYAFICIF